MIKNLINKIKQKSSLKNLDDKFVEKYIQEYFKNNPKIKSILENHPKPEKSKYFKKIIKEVRNELNKTYGIFWINNKLTLESHSSTKERLKLYPNIYKKIFLITGKPKSIIDISCGLNPLTYSQFKDIKFIATELTKNDCDKLKKYFKKNKIIGKVLQINLLNKNKFPKTDITFLFKILDIIPKNKTEEIIKSLQSKYIVVSFSLINIHGKKMNYPLQGWFQRMLKRLKLKYELIKEENEIFYIILRN